MKEQIRKLYHSEVIRYIFFGGCTTLVNLVVFYGLRKLGMGLNISNVISIIAAILFAYVVNSLFVFHDNCKKYEGSSAVLREIYQRPSGNHGG